MPDTLDSTYSVDFERTAIAVAYQNAEYVADQVLTGAACDPAHARLYDDAVPDAVAERAKGTRARLAAIASGSEELLDRQDQIVQRHVSVAAACSPAPIMTEQNLEGL